MTDEEIIEKFHQWFDTTGQISIENGLISCSGNVELRWKKISTLPIKFKEVGGDFDCNGCELTSLIGAPQSVGGDFLCYDNQLKSLAGAPQSVGGDFFCNNSNLTSLRGAPQYVGRDFGCVSNPLTSLAGAPQYVGEDLLLTYRKNLALLPLLMIKGCKQVNFAHIYHDDYHYDNGSLSEILNRYLGTGTQGMLPCADEMIEAGYGSNAHYD